MIDTVEEIPFHRRQWLGKHVQVEFEDTSNVDGVLVQWTDSYIAIARPDRPLKVFNWHWVTSVRPLLPDEVRLLLPEEES